MKDFWIGVITGAVAVAVIVGVIWCLMFFHNRGKELIEYAEKQIEIEALRENYIHRDPVEFLEVHGVRRAADGAAAEFDSKRDKIMERFRSRPTN